MTQASDKAPIGMVGLGNMGGAMAQRLTEQGETVVGCDVRAGRATELGVREAPSLEAIGRAASIILLSLPDSSVVERVMFGPGGLAAHVHAGQLVADLSTSSPVSTRATAEKLALAGVAFIDAGVSGGPRGARAGTLTIMAGGDAAALERVRPVLSKISKAIYHLGESGAGHTAKVLNNFLNAVNLAAASEAFIAAKKAKLDLHTFLAVVNGSSGMNSATVTRFPSILDGDYRDGNLSMKLMMKDLQLYMEAVRSLEVPSMVAPGCIGLFGAAIALGHESWVNNRIVDVVGEISGGVRLLES